MDNKPPAFQFYAKDWIASPTRLRMTHAERGLYFDLLAFAWDSDQPGTIDLPERDLCKILGISLKVFRKFIEKFPQTFQKIGTGLQQPRLHKQWLVMKQRHQQEVDSGRAGAEKRWGAHRVPTDTCIGSDSSAFASSTALPGNGVGAALSESERRAERAHELQMEVQKTAQVKAEAEILGRTERLSGRRDAQAGANPNNAGLPPISREKWEEWDRTMAERRAKKAQ